VTNRNTAGTSVLGTGTAARIDRFQCISATIVRAVPHLASARGAPMTGDLPDFDRTLRRGSLALVFAVLVGVLSGLALIGSYLLEPSPRAVTVAAHR
jgi:hypothetical protein